MCHHQGHRSKSKVIELVETLRLEPARPTLRTLVRSSLFRKYALLIGAVMGAVLLASSFIDVWFTARDHRAALIRIQSEQADAAAARISQFVKEIESQLGWMAHLSWSASSNEQRELDTLRLLRQVPAISEVVLIDGTGRERLRASRQAMDRIESHADLSADPNFVGALADKVHYGPVTFQRGTEPVMTISLAGTRRDAGVVSAVVNLTHVWDVVHTIRVGRAGRAYVVGRDGRLLAHPDLSLVLRNTDLSGTPQVLAARGAGAEARRSALVAPSTDGTSVLTAYAIAEPLKWLVFVELPEAEANEPLYATATRSILIALVGAGIALVAALALAHHMVVPIRALSAGAARIGAGALDHRISIKTGDELETLGTQFNEMADRVRSTYATLERQVVDRTRQLQDANLAKARFIAAASHDLRQPLHALNLLVAHLERTHDPTEKERIAHHVGVAVSHMNELFDALLDISRLDAGALTPTPRDFPVADLLDRVDQIFGPTVRDKGLHFSVVRSRTWIRSDPILLERILLNLVSNAVRYTAHGGVIIGCRRVGEQIRIDVCDSGPGIAPSQQQMIFAEFYRGTERVARGEGLGLGLAIVDRLAELLGHRIELASVQGRGSRFSVLVNAAEAGAGDTQPAVVRPLVEDKLKGKRILVIDDDALVLAGTGGLLESWGCEAVLAEGRAEAAERLAGVPPDLIISDHQLRDGTGPGAIVALRADFARDIPGFIISGNLDPALFATVRASGLHLMHKPLTASALRAMLESLVRTRSSGALS